MTNTQRDVLTMFLVVLGGAAGCADSKHPARDSLDGAGGDIGGGPGGETGAAEVDGGGGGASLPLCAGGRFSGAAAPARWLDIVINDGGPVSTPTPETGIFSLDARTPAGWQVTRVSGNLTAPAVLNDGGLLDALAAGDRIEVVEAQRCQPFSGCTSQVIARNAGTGVLISARLNDFVGSEVAFGTTLGIELSREPSCALPAMDTACRNDEAETHYRLMARGDQLVAVNPESDATVTLAGRAYRVRASLVSVTGGAALCADDLFAAGGVTISIDPS